MQSRPKLRKFMKVYFATHATSKDNEAGIASGWKDVELSELGIQQAKELEERFKDIKIDLICCSDLKRAVDTANIAFGSRDIKIIKDKRFILIPLVFNKIFIFNSFL